MNWDPLDFIIFAFDFKGNEIPSWYPYPWLVEYLIPGGEYYNPEIWSEESRPGEVGM